MFLLFFFLFFVLIVLNEKEQNKNLIMTEYDPNLDLSILCVICVYR